MEPRDRIDEGMALHRRRLSRRRAQLGPYQIQAAIAAVHDRARDGRRHRLAAGARALRPAGAGGAEPVRHARPRGGAGRGRRGRMPLRRCSTRSTAPLGDHQRLHAVRGHVAELRGDRCAARQPLPRGGGAGDEPGRAAPPDPAGGGAGPGQSEEPARLPRRGGVPRSGGASGRGARPGSHGRQPLRDSGARSHMGRRAVWLGEVAILGRLGEYGDSSGGVPATGRRWRRYRLTLETTPARAGSRWDAG